MPLRVLDQVSQMGLFLLVLSHRCDEGCNEGCDEGCDKGSDEGCAADWQA